MTFEISIEPKIDLIINQDCFEIIFGKSKPENLFKYNELTKVQWNKGKKFFLISFLSWIMEMITEIFIDKVYRDSDVFLIFKKDNKIIRKEFISEKINYANLDMAILKINNNIKQMNKSKTVPNTV